MSLTDALAADRAGKTVLAADLYEKTLNDSPTNVPAFANLLVLYWQATDFGIASHENLSRDFIEHAGNRLREMQDVAKRNMVDVPEARFWVKYIAWAEKGESFESAECRQLLQDFPNYLEPAMVLFSRSAGAEAEPEALRLVEKCSEAPTARCRYIQSVISGVLKRRRRPPSS
jgi:hypothetical protein